MGRHRIFDCETCMKKIRSDKVRAHRQICGQSSKYPIEKCRICQKSMIKWHMLRHMKQHDNHVLLNLKEDQNNYERLAETGKIIEEHVEREDINPNSLRRDYILALDVHHNENQSQDDKLTSLNPWQSKLIELMEPSERQILWIRGSVGNEGKSWFQDYLERYYGKRHVFRTTMDRKPESLLHTMSKRNLTFINVFIFNVPRSFDTSIVPYGFLEDIKDGKAISSKYNSKELKYVTPNIVIIFSNDAPWVEKLSSDRWMRYDISCDKLNVGFFSKSLENNSTKSVYATDSELGDDDYHYI